MLLVPNSSTMLMMFWRMPVRIEAMTMTVRTPMMIPRTVRNDRNLWAISVCIAMAMFSFC